MKTIVVTGAGGQIAYSLIFRIAAGEFLGPNQQIGLHLLDVEQANEGLKGLVMELEDCAFPLLKKVRFGSKPEEMFEGVDYAFLIGAKPRGPGMERKDLLADNGKIFAVQGKALNKVASKNVEVLVVGNPCNTNCLIAIHNAPDLNPKQFHSMTRLDQNRAVFQIAHKANVPVEAVSHMAIWGNHSSTQVADFVNAQIHGKKATEVIRDLDWFKKDFFPKIQKRGAEVIAARGKSSAASAANAALWAMRSIALPTECFSSGEYAKGNPYGVPSDLVFSFPCRKRSEVEILADWHWDDFLKEKIALTQKELLEERDMVTHLLRG